MKGHDLLGKGFEDWCKTRTPVSYDTDPLEDPWRYLDWSQEKDVRCMLPVVAKHQHTDMQWALFKQDWASFEKLWGWDFPRLRANLLCITPGETGAPSRGKTLLHLIAFRNFKLNEAHANSCYQAICMAAAEVKVLDVKDAKGATALHQACATGNVRFARHLLEQGASHFPTLRRLFFETDALVEAASRLGCP